MARLIVITFARAGLGHLRVANAIIEGVPAGTDTVLFSTTDRATSFFHRLSSINPIMRGIAEAMQHGLLEAVFTLLYTSSIRARAKRLLPQIEAVISQQQARPSELVFISTHFGLAHELCEIKAAIKEKTGVAVKVVVVVTDDSPQRAWSVPGADLTIVPSRETRRKLGAPNSRVVHYPLSPALGRELSPQKFAYRLAQADPESRVSVKIILPVSGAAVGLEFSRKLMEALHAKSPRFKFFIISREAPYTSEFLASVQDERYVSVERNTFDRMVVASYNKIIKRNTITYEITKPSEQAFKALYTPRQVGGTIMLLSQPVGRQEHDNLWYLERNGLIPNATQHRALWRHDTTMLAHARNWRALRLPKSPEKSAEFIDWCLSSGVFDQMLRFGKKPKSNGVARIWEAVSNL